MAENDVIRVVLVDDQQDVHDAITALLAQDKRIRLIGQAYNGDDAIRLCQMTKPDLVLMDVVMPGLSAPETTLKLLDIVPDVKVLVLSSYQEYEYIKGMLESGATGYIIKHAITDDLITTIRNTAAGKTVLSPEVARQVLDPPTTTPAQKFNLTEREQEVLQLMGNGLTDGQIATTLGISQRTVRFHFGNLLEKLKIETRSEMLVLEPKNDLI